MESSRADLFLLEAWVSENPGSRLFLELARAYRKQDRRPEAIRVLERGLVLRPEEVAARRLLAQVLLESGDKEGALRQLRLAAQELARHAGLFDDLAAILEQQGEGTEAGSARELGRSLGQWASPAQHPPEAADSAATPPEPAAESATDLLLARLQALRDAARARAGA